LVTPEKAGPSTRIVGVQEASVRMLKSIGMAIVGMLLIAAAVLAVLVVVVVALMAGSGFAYALGLPLGMGPPLLILAFAILATGVIFGVSTWRTF
jgi:hypothetical protein